MYHSYEATERGSSRTLSYGRTDAVKIQIEELSLYSVSALYRYIYPVERKCLRYLKVIRFPSWIYCYLMYSKQLYPISVTLFCFWGFIYRATSTSMQHLDLVTTTTYNTVIS